MAYNGDLVFMTEGRGRRGKCEYVGRVGGRQRVRILCVRP
jgi:hypothetical protein